MLKYIDGGVCAAQGFRAAGIHVGVKTHAAWKKDVALIVSDVECAAAGVFTKNVVKSAPIHVTKAHLVNGKARAVIANSGNANACAPQGEENAEKMCAAAAKAIGCAPEDMVVASTGVIGQTLNISVIEEGMPALYAALARSDEASDAAAHAIMTTDTVKKEVAVETVIGGKTVRMGGIAKGSGMIHPNMGTMLCFLTTDCAISPEMIKTALLETVNVSFNRISVDGDTSTNDTCCVLANGLAGNPTITEKGPDYDAFLAALRALCVEMAKKIMEGLDFTDRTFMGFINGKLLDSAIIGLICYIVCAILQMPYALLVSVIVGVTNVIPFFGPFIGAIPSSLIILLVDPIKCLIFVIFVILLQQLDGNVIGPKILGNSVGINGFWVMFSIIVGAGFFGFWGMLLGVPVFVVIYAAINGCVTRKLKRSDLPWEAADYRDIDYIDPVSYQPVKKDREDQA